MLKTHFKFSRRGGWMDEVSEVSCEAMAVYDFSPGGRDGRK